MQVTEREYTLEIPEMTIAGVSAKCWSTTTNDGKIKGMAR
jgi:hypothetical protein